MTVAVIGTGGIGSAIARRLASGGESLRLSSADSESARTLAAQIGPTAVAATDNRDVLTGPMPSSSPFGSPCWNAVIRRDRRPCWTTSSWWFRATRSASTRQAQRRTSPAGGTILRRGRSRVAAGRGALGHGVRIHVGRSPRVLQPPVTRVGGALLCDRRHPCRRGGRAADPDGRLRADEDRRDRPFRSTRGGRRSPRSRRRTPPRRGDCSVGTDRSDGRPGIGHRTGRRPDGLDGAALPS